MALVLRDGVDPDYHGDPMADPRVPFPLIMILVGMFIIAGVGAAMQSRGSRRESWS
jgi:hypothetical protein